MADKFKKQEQESTSMFSSFFSKKPKVHSDYVELEGGESFNQFMEEQQDEQIQQVRNKQKKNQKKQKGQSCCMCFSIKTGFFLYGVNDILELGVISFLMFKGWMPTLCLTYLCFQVPNVVVFLLVVIQDDLLSRKIYAYVLMFKGFVQTFVFPVILLEICDYFSNQYPSTEDPFCKKWGKYVIPTHSAFQHGDITVAMLPHNEDQLEAEALKMCRDTMLDIAVLIYMVLQLLAGYQIQLGQIYFNEKKQMEYANDKNRRLTEAAEKAKKINILNVRDHLKKIREQLRDQQIDAMKRGQSTYSAAESGVQNEQGFSTSIN